MKRFILKMFVLLLLLATTAEAQTHKFGLLLSQRGTSLAIQRQLFAVCGDSIKADIPLPKVFESPDSNVLTFYDIIVSGRIDYAKYGPVFDTAHSFQDFHRQVQEQALADSFISIRGHLVLNADSIKVVVDSVANHFFRSKNYITRLQAFPTIMGLNIDTLNTDVNGQQVEAFLHASATMKRAALYTVDFDRSGITMLGDSCRHYLETLSQTGFALFIDTGFVRSKLPMSTGYGDLKIEQPSITFSKDSVTINCVLHGRYQAYNLHNRYNVTLTVEPDLFRIRNLVVTAQPPINGADFTIVRYLASKWLQLNKGKTFGYTNALQTMPLHISGRTYKPRVDVVYTFYQSGNLILLCTVFD